MNIQKSPYTYCPLCGWVETNVYNFTNTLKPHTTILCEQCIKEVYNTYTTQKEKL